MNRKILPLILVSLLAGSSCSKDEGKDYSGRTLVIYNVEDYISNGDDDSVDLIKNFEEEFGCEVKYYTYDTNETMYNQFKLQKEGTYDLVLGSEYIIQKMAKEGLIQEFDYSKIPNYVDYSSSILRDKLASMKVIVDGEESDLNHYAVGYMWGTLGIIYDPNKVDVDEYGGILSWDVLYNSKYQDKISMKNSMRDTYDAGLIHGFSKTQEYQEKLQLYKEYLVDGDEEKAKEFNNYIQSVFDFKLDGSEESILENQYKISLVRDELIEMKKNIFGFETDSGKNDIVEGSKIWMDLAYSGDAVYSISCALEETNKILEYVVPSEGGNIWYDAWMLPKGCKNEDLAYEFLNYISSSENAAANADYIGYTPFIVGDEIFTTLAGSYGASEFDIDQTYCEGQYVYKDNILYCCLNDDTCGVDVNNEEYYSCEEYDEDYRYSISDMVSKDGLFYYCDNEIDFEDRFRIANINYSKHSMNATYNKNDLVMYNNSLYCCNSNTVIGPFSDNEGFFDSYEYDSGTHYNIGDLVSLDGKIYECYNEERLDFNNAFDEENNIEGYDLSHIYGSSLSNRSAIIYPYDGSLNQLETQYPSKQTIYRCAIMNDYGVYNDDVVIMWGQIKAYTDMNFVYISLI